MGAESQGLPNVTDALLQGGADGKIVHVSKKIHTREYHIGATNPVV
jgi:hypothetical protein